MAGSPRRENSKTSTDVPVVLGIVVALVALSVVSAAVAQRSTRWRRAAIVVLVLLVIGAVEALFIYLDANEILTP